jgi:ketosteroid isomerase-like protein
MKKTSIVVSLFLVAIILPTACDSPATKEEENFLEEVKKAIAESNALYFQSFEKGDSSLFIDRYADDCCIMAPNTPALCGKEAALRFFRIAYYDIGLRNGNFITTNVFGNGKEYVTEVGLWQSFDASNNLFDDGKFLVLWKKTPKGWKMFRDSFSSNRTK